MSHAQKELLVAMPSIAELVGFLSPHKVLALEGAIEFQSQEYQKFVKLQKYVQAPSHFLAFVIPLDSHLALPEAYGSVVHMSPTHEASITILHHAALKIALGNNKITAVLNVLVAALGDEDGLTPLAELDKTTIMQKYQAAIKLANHTIMAYKLTPERHNHDLRPITVTDRPSYVDVFRFDSTTGHIIEAGTVTMHQNLLASQEHAGLLDAQQHDHFRRNFQTLLSPNNAHTADIMSTIYQAIDAVCVGNYTASLVLADTYTEHFMRYALLLVFVHRGADKETAMRQVDDLRTMQRLVRALAAALNMTPKAFEQSIGYKTWQEVCRYKRNHITHQFTKTTLDVSEARTAVRTTIHMTVTLTRLIVRTFHAMLPQMQLFELPILYMDSIENYDKSDGAALSTVYDIIPYKYG